MSYLKEQVSYIHGLADGLGLENCQSPEGKVIAAILSLLNDMADSIEENEAAIDDLSEGVESVSEDLEDLEELIYGDDEEDECDCCEEEDNVVELQCPHCGNVIFYDSEMIESEEDLICPNCKQPVVVVVREDEEEEE